VRPGGFVIYSTCSLEPEENEQVVAAVLAEIPSVRQISLASRIESLESSGILAPTAAERLQASLTPEGALRLIPGEFPTDGFFVALLIRTKT
jgi:16S rRNA (cytosine967-C5)-methyltransferase